ncbi:MAG: DNA-processing protein DprA, partial [Candidatus Velthaea sp.]
MERGLVLLAAARLRIGGRRLRALALGDAQAVRGFVQSDSALRLAEARRDARADGALLERCGARIVTLADDDYPAGLRDLTGPPAFLCVRGMLPRGGIAIVGARNASADAADFAYELARRLDTPLVSGLARGVDAAAHRGALAAGAHDGRAVGVLARRAERTMTAPLDGLQARLAASDRPPP